MSDVREDRPLNDVQLVRRAGVIYLAALVVLGPVVAITAPFAPLLTQLMLALAGSALIVVLAGLVAGVMEEARRGAGRFAARRPQRDADDQPTAMASAA